MKNLVHQFSHFLCEISTAVFNNVIFKQKMEMNDCTKFCNSFSIGSFVNCIIEYSKVSLMNLIIDKCYINDKTKNGEFFIQ